MNYKKFTALFVISSMLFGITSCGEPEEKTKDTKGKDDEKAITDVVDKYMVYATSGKYDKAANLTQETEFNIQTMFDYLDENQTYIVDYLITTTEYEIKDAKLKDDEASCKVEIKVIDYESVYESYGDFWALDEFLEELKDAKDTVKETFKLNLVLDGDEWIIKTDADIADFYYNLIETFEVPSGNELTEEAIYRYIDSAFMVPEVALQLINESDVAYVINGMLNTDWGRLDFLSKYYYYGDFDVSIYGTDDNGSVRVTVTSYLPVITDLKNMIFTDRDLAVIVTAYSYTSPERMDEAMDEIEQLYVTAYKEALQQVSTGIKTVDYTVSVGADGNYIFEGNSLGDSFLMDINFDNLDGISSEEYATIVIEAIEYAFDHNIIDYETYLIYKESVVPSHANEDTLYVENNIFYIDDRILGMTYSEANDFFGGDFPEQLVWEWGNYDYYFDYVFNGVNYTFFTKSGLISAVRYEFYGSDIPENILTEYNRLYGYSVTLCDEYGDFIPRGLHNSGFEFYTDSGPLKVFMNVYDEISHVAVEYRMW